MQQASKRREIEITDFVSRIADDVDAGRDEFGAVDINIGRIAGVGAGCREQQFFAGEGGEYETAAEIVNRLARRERGNNICRTAACAEFGGAAGPGGVVEIRRDPICRRRAAIVAPRGLEWN